MNEQRTARRGRPRRCTPARRVQFTLPEGHPLAEFFAPHMRPAQMGATILAWATLYKLGGAERTLPAPQATADAVHAHELRGLAGNADFDACLAFGAA